MERGIVQCLAQSLRSQTLHWFESYLKDIKPFILVYNKQSELRGMKFGVPQGSVLGPLPFLTYTNKYFRSVILVQVLSV